MLIQAGDDSGLEEGRGPSGGCVRMAWTGFTGGRGWRGKGQLEREVSRGCEQVLGYVGGGPRMRA